MLSAPRSELVDLPDPTQAVPIPPAPFRSHGALPRHMEDEAPSNASELETDILRLAGPGSAIGRWEGADVIYMRTVGERRCPHGRVHHSDNFMIRLEGQDVWFGATAVSHLNAGLTRAGCWAPCRVDGPFREKGTRVAGSLAS